MAAALLFMPIRYQHYEVATQSDGSPSELGRSASGVTYRAFDADLQVPVALKVIPVALVGDEARRLRFLRDVRAATLLHHPHIGAVFRQGEEAETHYFIASELVEGESLQTIVERGGPVAPTDALEIVRVAAEALDAALAGGLVHRRVRPANLMVAAGPHGHVVKLIGFGLAQLAALDPTASSFTSPEASAASPDDPRPDGYALGVTLWYLVTGELPSGPTSIEGGALAGPSPGRLREAPAPIVRLLWRMLERDPAARFPNPGALRDAIKRCQRDVTAIAPAALSFPGSSSSRNSAASPR